MKFKKGLIFVALLFSVLVGGYANASLVTDTDAILTGTTGNLLRSDVINGQSYTFETHIDYAVYAPGGYKGSLGLPADEYVYAYQLYNSSQSNVVIDSFTMGLIVDSLASNACSDSSIGDAGGVGSGFEFVLTGNVLYGFQSAVDPGEYSNVLMFTSPYEYTWAYGDVEGGVLGGIESLLPTPNPVPEPTTLVILASAGLVGLMRRKK